MNTELPRRRPGPGVQDRQAEPNHTPILISGGGLIGLSTALFLQHQGVPFILTEQQDTLAVLPRARGFHVRSMELFRQVGLEDALKEAAAEAWKVGTFGGARKGPSVLESRPIAAFDPKAMMRMSDTVPSPSGFLGCPQRAVEKVLLGALLARGGDVRFGHRLDTFTQGPAGVTAKVTDLHTGQTTVLQADYLIAADGGRGPARHALNIDSDRTPPTQAYLNIFFRADLTARLEGRTFSQCDVENAQVKGIVMSHNNATEWSFQLEYDPEQTDPAAFTAGELVALARSAIGDPQQPVDIIATSPWNNAVRVARQYRAGRVFLLGDAAHVMPPSGGFNGNTGVADAHNLAWKLAAVLAGHAGDDLLDSYQTERRPFATRNGEQALLRGEFSARFGLKTAENGAEVARQVEMNALHMKFAYPEPGGPDPEQPVDRLQAQPGTRFPHAWLTCGAEQRSTLDLFGRGFTLLLGPAAPIQPEDLAWPAEVRPYRLGQEFGFADPDLTWAALTGLPEDGAVLVRPDGFVQQRSETGKARQPNEPAAAEG